MKKRFQNFNPQSEQKSHQTKIKTVTKKKKNQKTNKVQKLTETKEKGYFKKMKSIPV